MPRFKIGGGYGYVGTDWEHEIEAENEEDALEYAKDQAFERVEYWAEEIPEADTTNND